MKALPLVLLSALFFSIACGSVEAAGKPAQLSVTFDKEEYAKSDAVSIGFTLKNISKAPVHVNKRFQIASKASPGEDREIYLNIVGPGGQEVPYKAQPYKMGLPKSDYFVLLNPGDEATSERKMNLRVFFELDTPGEYKVTATYQNAYGKEIGLDVFNKEIESKPVTVKIRE